MKYDVKKLTLEEKLSMLTGMDGWHTSTANGKVRGVSVADGPNGLRKVDPDRTTRKATSMPALSLVTNSWDRALAYLDGETIAADCADNDVDVLLAPGVNIKRTPLCGRNFEYFSEDPFLAGTMAREYIRGVQDCGVGTSLKHFCANNREKGRITQTSEVDERTLHEIYLKPFEMALEADPWTVMCSYNPLNGAYVSESKKMLSGVLRGQLGYKGLIMSDWGAVRNPYKSIKATLDLIMPYNKNTVENVKDALDKGFITIEEIDFCVKNVLSLAEKAENAEKTARYTPQERHENAVRIAEGGMVLLKNEENVLPLSGGKNYLVCGKLAKEPTTVGGGSAKVQTAYEQRPLYDLLAEKLPKATFEAYLRPGKIFNNPDRVELQFVREGYEKAYGKDAVIICVEGECESEGYDRNFIRLLPEYEEFIKNAARYNKNVIVVVFAGSAVDMSAWIDDVKAVVLAGLAGEGANEALSAILAGEVNPSGKLAETFVWDLDDTYTGDDTGDGFTERYDDGVFVGYRYYDKYDIDVLFPFGHGLSYANFRYDNLTVEKKGVTDFTVSFDVTNTSSVDGAEVSQVYVRDIYSMVSRPDKELQGFAKTFVKAGETKRVSVELDDRSFAYYSTELDRWYVESGPFEILVGASSRDIRLCGKAEIDLPDEEQLSK